MKEEIGKQMKEIIEESEFSVLFTLPGVGVIIASQLIVAYLTHKFSSYETFKGTRELLRLTMEAVTRIPPR